MANSIFLARLIGPLMLAVGIGMFVNGAVYRDAGGRVPAQPRADLPLRPAHHDGRPRDRAHPQCVARRLAGAHHHPRLARRRSAAPSASSRPQGTERVGRQMLKHKHGLTIGGAVWLAVGAVLCFFGYRPLTRFLTTRRSTGAKQ